MFLTSPFIDQALEHSEPRSVSAIAILQQLARARKLRRRRPFAKRILFH